VIEEVNGRRLFTEDYLSALAENGSDGMEELKRKLSMVKVSEELSHDEKAENIDRINYALSGGQKFSREDVDEDIKAGLADIEDIGGH